MEAPTATACLYSWLLLLFEPMALAKPHNENVLLVNCDGAQCSATQ